MAYAIGKSRDITSFGTPIGKKNDQGSVTYNQFNRGGISKFPIVSGGIVTKAKTLGNGIIPSTLPTVPLIPGKNGTVTYGNKVFQNNTNNTGIIPTDPNKIDLFADAGGYDGLLGVAPGTLNQAGTHKLSTLYNMPNMFPQAQVSGSNSDTAGQLSPLLGTLANNGVNPQPGSPLSPVNPTANKKGPPKPF